MGGPPGSHGRPPGPDRTDRRWLCRQLASYDITRAEVDRRLRALCAVEDPVAAPVRVGLVPWDIAHHRAVEALRRGMNEGKAA